MTNTFLKAKHWQLFLLTYGAPMIIHLVIMGSLMANIASHTIPDPTMMLGYMKLFPVLMVVFMAVLFGWLWSVAMGLQKKVPENVKMKVTRFKVFFFIPLVYLLLFVANFSLIVNWQLTALPVPNAATIAGLFAIVVPLHLFSMFCIFYSFYFAAKTFKTVQLQREVNFGDFAGEFFMVWFYFIGVWILQPKINKMVEE